MEEIYFACFARHRNKGKTNKQTYAYKNIVTEINGKTLTDFSDAFSALGSATKIRCPQMHTNKIFALY